MKSNYKLWDADDIQEIITTANSSRNKQKAFGKLGVKFNRSHDSIQKIYYKNRYKKTLNIPKEEREAAIKRLSARGLSQRDIALRHKISQTSVSFILNKRKDVKTKQEEITQTPELFNSKQERDDHIRLLSKEGESTRKIAKQVGLGKSMVGDILRGYEYRKDTNNTQPKQIKPSVKETATAVVSTYELSILWGAFKITNKTINK
jgi:transposase